MNPVSGCAASFNAQVPFRSERNPPATQPFSIEVWAEPAVDPTVVGGAGPCPLFNRQSAGNRTGWAWFQRGANVGWNLAMYITLGSSVSIDMGGGTAIPGTTNHLVATWDGSTARLDHNGTLVETEVGAYLTQHPTPTGFVSVTPRQSWHFEAWFCDVASGVATSNLTDGLRVTFD